MDTQGRFKVNLSNVMDVIGRLTLNFMKLDTLTLKTI